MASVARTRSNEADGAVQVLAVIPAGERFHPGLGVCLCGKALGRPVRAIFAGSKERLMNNPVKFTGKEINELFS